MNWRDKKTVQKGTYGEQLVRSKFEQQGYIVYLPATDGPHGSDFFCLKQKSNLLMAEVKSKSRRDAYPDTGINYEHYLTYKELSKKHNMPIWLVFVDEKLAQIYGNTLSELDVQFPTKHKGSFRNYPRTEPTKSGQLITYFHLDQFKKISDLSNEEISKLQELTSK